MNNYEIFLKTAEIGNITRTAKLLNYTQSGISQAINSLEKELGFKLFTRSKKGVEITENGKLILPDIQALVNQQIKLNQSINDINSLIKGKIRIAAFPSVITEFVIDCITTFNKKYSEVEFEILDGTYDQISNDLNNGTADIGFLPEAYISNFDSTMVYEDEVMAMVPPEHELCRYKSIELSQLLEYPFISQYKGCEQYLEEITDSVVPEYLFYDDRVAIKMISRGFGVGIITDSMLKYINIPVVTRSFSPEIKRRIYMVLPNEQNTTNLIKVFKEYAKGYSFDKKNKNEQIF